ncbi:MAG: response regulator [Naasia sp.]
MVAGTLKILVVEDDDFTRTLVGTALRGAGHLVVDVDSVQLAMRALRADDFHLVVSDLNLGNGPSGADLLGRVHEDQPWMGMVALTSHASPELAIGPDARLPAPTVYLVKSELRDIQSLFDAIDRALSGEAAVERDDSADGRAVVTRSQAEVLRMLSAGFATGVIAERRSTTVRAAEMMIQRLYDKLGLKESSDLDPRTGAVLLWQQGRVRVQ